MADSITIKFVEKDNYRGMIKVLANLEKQTASANRATAEQMVKYMKKNWYPSSPSPDSGESFPAKDTHNLDRSVQAETQGRDVLGRFAGKDTPQVWWVSLDTTKGGDNQDRGQYSMPLEYGHIHNKSGTFVAPRPFFTPTIKYGESFYITELIKRLKF